MRKIKNRSHDNNDKPNINKQENKPWWFVGGPGSWAPLGHGCWLTLGLVLLQVGRGRGVSAASVGAWSPLSSPCVYGLAGESGGLSGRSMVGTGPGSAGAGCESRAPFGGNAQCGPGRAPVVPWH